MNHRNVQNLQVQTSKAKYSPVSISLSSPTSSQNDMYSKDYRMKRQKYLKDAEEVLEHLIEKKMIQSFPQKNPDVIRGRRKVKNNPERKRKEKEKQRIGSQSVSSSSDSSKDSDTSSKVDSGLDLSSSQGSQLSESEEALNKQIEAKLFDQESQLFDECLDSASEQSELEEQFSKINDYVMNFNNATISLKNNFRSIEADSKIIKEDEQFQILSLDFTDIKKIMREYDIEDEFALRELIAGEERNQQDQKRQYELFQQSGYLKRQKQIRLERLKHFQMRKRRDFLKGQLSQLQEEMQKIQATDQLMANLFVSDDQSTSESQHLIEVQDIYESHLRDFEDFRGSQDSDRTLSYISDMETENPKSDFNKQRRRDIKELSKQFAKEAIKRHNKKQLQAFTFTTESRLPGRMRPSLNDLVDDDFDISWVHTSERFKSFNRTKQILTIPSSTPEQAEDYKRQELDRYKYPLNPWMYSLMDGRKAIVGPVFRKRAQIQNTPRQHLFLKNDRPPGVNILALVRDAAARLPDHIGTRTDVAELVKDSQFLADGLTDYYISQTVSGGLDRLSAEEDPSVRFDPSSKLWIYLHGKRTLDSAKWGSDITESTRNNFQKNNEKYFLNTVLNNKSGSMGMSMTMIGSHKDHMGGSPLNGNSNDTTDVGTSSLANNLSQDD